MRVLGRLLLSCVLLHSTAVQAEDPLARLRELVETGQMGTAYQQALPYFEQLAGDPDFDYAYGVAAIDSGHLNEGVFALERVLMARPDDHRARLEYARGLFMLGEDAQAREQFTRVLEVADPPERVRERIDAYLAAIRLRESRYRTTASAYLSLGGGYDTNINSAPDGAIETFLGTLEAQDRDDAFTQMGVGAQVFHPLARHTRLFGRWDSRLRNYHEAHDQDNASHSLTLGGLWTLDQHRLSLGVNGQLYQLDDARYRKTAGLELGWSRSLAESLAADAGLLLQRHRHPDATLRFRDSRLTLASLRLRGNLQLPLTPSWQAGLFYGDERADQQHNSTSLALVDRRLRGGQLGGQLSLRQDLSLALSALVQESDYAGLDGLSGKVREDRYAALDSRLRWLLDDQWQLELQFLLSRNDSNIALYAYRRTQSSLNLRYDF